MKSNWKYIGYLKVNNKLPSSIYFTWDASSANGDDIHLAYDNGTWKVSSFSDQISNTVPSAISVEQGNFDKPTKTFMRMMTTSQGTSPSGVLSGNQFFVISMSTDDGTQAYNAQIAFSFSADAIAIRRKNGSTTWGSWKAIT
jgi:hypothetical protein